MKKFTALCVILSFMAFSIGYVSQPFAGEVLTETISSVSQAKEIAAAAKGGYWEGASAPALSKSEIALPVVDEATGKVIGHIVAEKGKLISALNAAGYAKAATALAAVEAGTAAGVAVGAGVAIGTTGVMVSGIALVVGGAIAVAESSTTVHH